MKNFLLFLLFAFSFGIECYAGSPFLPYKSNGAFYSKTEIVSAYQQKDIYLERLSIRIEQVARHDGWANQISLPLTKAHALYFLNRMEEGNQSWSSGEYEVDDVSGSGFAFIGRPSYENRASKELGPEGVLFLDPAKAGIKGNYPKRSLIARICGNTKSGIPVGSLKEESPLTMVSSEKPASLTTPVISDGGTQSQQIWVKQAPQQIIVMNAQPEYAPQGNQQNYVGYYEDRTANICCNQGAVNIRTVYYDVNSGPGWGSWGIPFGGGWFSCGNNFGGYLIGGYFNTDGQYSDSSLYPGNFYNYGGTNNGNGGYSGSGGHSGSGGNVIQTGPRGPR
jgi:hypothetical protein